MSKFKWQTNTEHDFVKMTQKLKKCLDTGKLAKMANTFIKGIQKLFLKNTMLWNVKVKHSSTCKLWKQLLFK